jgi:hypothetical protein
MRYPRALAAAGFAPLLAAAACGDGTAPAPQPPPVRTILLHRQDTGENLLLNTDGSSAGAFVPDVPGMIPIGASALGGIAVLLDGRAIVLATLDHPERVDTIINPAPQVLGLASFSADELLVALVSYQPDSAVLVYDRANRLVDTLRYGNVDPALPPLIGPDNDRIAVLSATPLSLFITSLSRSNPGQPRADAIRVARVITRPIFGWPRWTADGIVLAFVRLATAGPDTLVVGRFDPDAPDVPLVELYQALLAPGSDAQPEHDQYATYALTADVRTLVLGAQVAGGAGRQAIYLVRSGAAHAETLLDAPGQFPLYPQFLRE